MGVHGTAATGISGSNIVGVYWDSANYEHGFLYNGSTYTTIDDPLTLIDTEPLGISGSDIVGTYTDRSGNEHGFLYNGSTFTTIDDPLGVTINEVWGISGSTIVGAYWDSSEVYHGYVATLPEPGTLSLLGAGVLSLVAFVWRWRVMA